MQSNNPIHFQNKKLQKQNNPKNTKFQKQLTQLILKQQNQQNIQALCQQALYMVEDMDNDDNVVKFGYDKQYSTVYSIYGFGNHPITQSFNKYKLNLIRILHNQIEHIQKNKQKSRGIVLVYFCDYTPQNNVKQANRTKNAIKLYAYTQFKNEVLKKLPIHYLCYIKNIYVVYQSFLSKFSPFSKLSLHSQIIDTLTKYHDSLQQLVSQLGPLFQCQMIKQQVQLHNSSLNWLQLYSTQQKKHHKRQMLFQLGPSYSQTPTPYNPKLLDYQLHHQTRIPLLLYSLLKLIAQNQRYYKSQGIFRKACDQEKLGKLERELVGACLEEEIVGVAGRYETDTVATMTTTSTPASTPPTLSQPQQQTLLTHLSTQLPPTQKTTLLYIINFFQHNILPYQKYNKMSIYNLSVVMGPCIFRPKKYQINDLIQSPRFAALLEVLIRRPDVLGDFQDGKGK